jgi:hypothetical protein
MQIAGVYSEFVRGLVPRAASMSLPLQKRFLLRFGALAPSMLAPEQVQIFDSALQQKSTPEPLFYLDEWFAEIAAGRAELSTPDGNFRTGESAADTSNRMQELKTRHSGRLEVLSEDIRQKEQKRQLLEGDLKSKVQDLCYHAPLVGLPECSISYTEPQRQLLTSINHLLRDLHALDGEIVAALDSYRNVVTAVEKVDTKISLVAGVDPGISVVNALKEAETLEEIEELLIGKNGNSFPLLSKEFFHCDGRTTGFRENVLDLLGKIEGIDPNVFCRVHKDVKRRIVPEILLLPCYGERGICWQPLSKSNIVTSRGRLAIPMYPKNLQYALLTALGQLRWQTSKVKASYYWMSEGLTGAYYQWFTSQKLKGDPEESFVQSYILWIVKESTGIQQLDHDLREIFWHHIPFPQKHRERLSTRSASYQELWRKEQ